MQRRGRWSSAAVLVPAHSLPYAADDVRSRAREDAAAGRSRRRRTAWLPAGLAVSLCVAAATLHAAPKPGASSAVNGTAKGKRLAAGVNPGGVTSPAPASDADHDRRVQEGDRAYDSGRWAEAEKAYRQADAMRTDEPAVLGKLAAVVLRQERTAEAVELYDRALKLEPGRLEFQLGHARALGANGQFQDASREYEAIVQSHPNEYLALLGAAQTHGWAGEYRQAADCYERLLARHSDSTEGLLGLASVLAWSDQFDRAMDVYGRVLKGDPKNKEARVGVARVYGWTGDVAKARQAYEELLNESPTDHVLLVDYAKVLAWAEEYKRAIEIYEQLLKDDPANMEARVGLARVVASDGDLVRAEKLYDEILTEQPENQSAVLGKIQVLHWGGRPLGSTKTSPGAHTEDGASPLAPPGGPPARPGALRGSQG